MRKFFLLIAMVIATIAQAQMMPLPLDPAVRKGTLDNGLTYYIRHNEHPEHVANFYIAQRVGSIQEEEDQRGLAHFLEHMAFNGSTNFKPGDLIEYTRSLGVAFGQDLNAYTSIEQTVYNIDNVPTTRIEALDSCLLILKDWSNGLLLLPEEIDKERGVVHGEWAMRNSATQRLFERSLPLMYPGCKYGERMPIGLMSVIDNFSPEALRAYYEKWYHPENQAIIVVGDIDVDRTEQKIKELFAEIKAGPKAAHVVPVEVPDNAEGIYIFDKDKEMPYSMIEVLMKSDPMPEEMKGTQMEYVQSYLTSMITMMFNSRMQEISQNADCPFTSLHMGYGKYLISKTKDAFDIDATPKEGKEKETLEAVVRELKRAKLYGFTGGEFNRAKEELLSIIQKQYDNRDKRTNSEFYNEMVKNYLDKEAMPGADIDYQLYQVLAQQLPLEAINQTLAESITVESDSNFVCLMFAQEKEGKAYPTPADLKKIVDGARAENVEAWVDNTKQEPLMASMPKAGKIKKETENKALGYKELLLSNGAKVILKKTDFKDNEIVLSAWAPGGKSQYGAADYSNLKLFAAAANACGLGSFSNNDLTKALAGKQVGVSIDLGNRYANVSGNSTPKDLETMMQLLYLHFTSLQKDEAAYNKLMTQLETMLKNRDLQPETALSDTLTAELYCNNPRFKSITVDELKNVSYDRVMQIAKENYAAANNFTFAFIGNFDEDVLRQYVCQYIASLPGKEKAKKQTDVRTYFSGVKENQFIRKMETPKPMVVKMYKGTAENTLEDNVLADYVGNVLSMILLKTVREEAGATYSVGASAGISYAPGATYSVMQIYAPISAPEKTDIAIQLMDEGVKELSEKADPDMVAKVKANFLKQADVDAKENSHWMSVISDYCIEGVDMHTNYKAFVESVTPEMVSAFLKNKILAAQNRLTVIMRPQE